MRPMQSDDINVREPKRRFRFIHLPTKKIVRAETKTKAIKQAKISLAGGFFRIGLFFYRSISLLLEDFFLTGDFLCADYLSLDYVI